MGARAEEQRYLARVRQAADIAAALTPGQRHELAALDDGRWRGDPLEVSGLRQLGLQNDGLGLTDLGLEVLVIVQRSWRAR